MIKYAFMTYRFHVYPMFDEMSSMHWESLGQEVAQVWIIYHCYDSGKLQVAVTWRLA